MKRSRGNKTSGTARAVRRARALQLMKEGKAASAIARELRVSRMTFWRDLQSIEAQYVAGSTEDVKQFKEAQYRALMKLEEATAKGTIEPDVANALVRIRDSVAKLLGLNAENRSVVAHLSAPTDLLFLRFKKSVSGLTDAQIEEVFAYAVGLKREINTVVKDASWFPEPPQKQLSGGGDVESA